ncbi:MAG: hypothetical protein DWI57_07030, partial [Chloroflexi bacterium]
MAQMTARQPVSWRFTPGRTILYLVVLGLCVLFGFPVFWTLMSSFKTTAEMAAFPPVIIPDVFQ